MELMFLICNWDKGLTCGLEMRIVTMNWKIEIGESRFGNGDMGLVMGIRDGVSGFV